MNIGATKMRNNFKENLRFLRLNSGLTQKQLAEKLNVDQRTVSAWEKGVSEPDFETLDKLCEIFKEDYNGLLS